MRRFDIFQETNSINFHRKIFQDYLKQSTLILNKLHETFNLQDINLPTSKLKDNSFDFEFWGLTFLIKAEIAYDLERKSFLLGELNTYAKKDDAEILILTYSFDTIGNIENNFIAESFPKFYYVDFVPKVIEYTNKYKVKFLLK